MFSKFQTAVVAALFATNALAYTPADYDSDAVLVTVTVTNTKTWCPCEKTGLSSWATWSTATPSDKTTESTSFPWTSSTSTTTFTKPIFTTPYANSSTTTTTTTSDPVTTTTSTTSEAVVTTPYANSTTTTSTTTASSTPTVTPRCKLVEWNPEQCQDDSYFKLGDEYLYQSCGRTLVETDSYLEDWIEIFCGATTIFDPSYKATAWDPATNRCYVYTEDDALTPSSFPDSKIFAAGNADYTIKFDTNPCAGFNSTGPFF